MQPGLKPRPDVLHHSTVFDKKAVKGRSGIPRNGLALFFATLFYSYVPYITTVKSVVHFLSSFYATGFGTFFLDVGVIILYVQCPTCDSEVCVEALNFIKQYWGSP